MIKIKEYNKKIHEMILMFTKKISFSKNIRSDGSMLFSNSYFPAITLFLDEDFNKIIENLSCLLLNQEYPCIDEIKDVEELIFDCLKKNIINPNIIDSKKIYHNNTLFQSIKTDDLEFFTNTIYNEIYNYLENNYISKKTIIFPMYKFNIQSFNINNIEYININNTEGKEIFNKRFKDLQNDIINFNCSSLSGFIIFEGTNTYNKIIEEAEREIKQFLSVFYSFSNHKKSSMHFSCADVNKNFILLNYKTNDIHNRSFDLEIHPSYLNDYASAVELEKIDEWYKKKNYLPNEIKNKINQAEYHLNRALNNHGNKDEQYEQSYIAIDSLFGENNRVNELIVKNVLNISEDSQLKTKITYLWKIRCSLLHGNIIKMRHSLDYRKYYKKFKTLPEDDIINIAFLCLNKSVDHFNSESYINNISNNEIDNISYKLKFIKIYNIFIEKLKLK